LRFGNIANTFSGGVTVDPEFHLTDQ